MAAAYYAQFELNDGKPIGESIPATEHSVMTSWRTEKEAIENMIEKFGTALFACVLDSYDYANCLDNILPQIKDAKEKAGGHMVLRPDSGDPVEAVLMGLRAAEKTFGATTNKKGYKVINNASVIQGDGVGYSEIKKILNTVMEEGYSAASVTFGMGAGLLQKHNRDTMSFATKLSQITYPDGTVRDVMKFPKSDGAKISLPGELKVIRNSEGVPVIYPTETEVEGEDLLEVVYDNGPVEGVFSESFDDLRARVAKEWNALPKTFDPISPQLHEKIKVWCENQKKVLAAMLSK
jgi:nicotinic acid phosphoribosyltransferase